MKRCFACQRVFPFAEFGTKGHRANGTVRYQPRCLGCAREYDRGRTAPTADPLGADPLLPIEPFREWLERLIARRTLAVAYPGCDVRPGVIKEIGRELTVRFGGSQDAWCRKILRWRVEFSRIRLTDADELLTVLDFDGVTVGDLWPLDEDVAA